MNTKTIFVVMNTTSAVVKIRSERLKPVRDLDL